MRLLHGDRCHHLWPAECCGFGGNPHNLWSSRGEGTHA
ncbi:hypothetical protein SHJG_3838 [Streptomyces hygroscopicus subsp. jinggangensis 5008]|nr:hypothetical protein SHJG_3838 [Streptomyces hygroscopicus subsp. jinggangensis 5008]AGF63268.1 hypothetical protein SHJGH_3603 [Streptomyces hygroscopicus subsp. jinggangensis TL01]